MFGMNTKRLLLLSFAVLAFTLMFGLSGVTAHSYGHSYGGSYSSHVVKTSPYYNYEKSVYSDPWSYTSSVKRVNYGNNYYRSYYPVSYGYNYPTNHYGYGNSYRNGLGRYMNYGYYPPQYVSRTVHRSYW
jgi:uncharacterized membrane protein